MPQTYRCMTHRAVDPPFRRSIDLRFRRSVAAVAPPVNVGRAFGASAVTFSSRPALNMLLGSRAATARP